MLGIQWLTDTIPVPLPVCWHLSLAPGVQEARLALSFPVSWTWQNLSHTTSDLVGDRSCFLHSISRNLISLQYIALHANSMSTERGEKLTENILPDGENWNITLVSLPAQIHSDRLEMIYGSGGHGGREYEERKHTYTSRDINCCTMLKSLHCFACMQLVPRITYAAMFARWSLHETNKPGGYDAC